MDSRRIVMLVLGFVALVLGLGFGVAKLLSGDHDEYGRIAIPPGRGEVDLPAGEVSVFYEDGRPIAIDDATDEPEVEWTIRPASGGALLPLDGDGGRETDINETRVWADFETLDVPEAGAYEVRIIEAATPGAEPAVTFGSSGVSSAALVLAIGGVVIGTVLITFALLTGRGEDAGDG